jgi:hypothetical protein
MSARRNAGLAAALITGLAAGCGDPAGPQADYTGPADVGRILMSFGTDPLRFRRDAWVLDTARIDGDTLHLRVTHGGGCARHGYALIAWNGWLESNPVQVGVLLAHDARGDACEALLFPDLRFDLEPLRSAWLRDYGGEHGTLVLRFTDPLNPAGPPLGTLTWSF